MKCEHCAANIKDLKKAWNRAGHHWCSKTCYEEDTAYANSSKLISASKRR